MTEALFGIVVAFLLIKLAFGERRTKTQAVIMLYCSVALAFGGTYYLIYLNDRTQFVFNDGLIRSSDIGASLNSEDDVSRRLGRIHLLDAFLLSFSRDIHSDQVFEFSVGSSGWKRLDRSFLYRCHVNVKMVGPQRDTPVYSSFLDVKTDKATLGLKPDIESQFLVNLPESDRFEMDGGTLSAYLGTTRVGELESLRDQYVHETAQWQPFHLWDFYYFSFTIVMAADVIAARTPIRLLVVFQILTLLGLVALREELRQS